MGGIILLFMLLFLLLIPTCIIEMIPLLILKNRGKWIKTSLLCNVITNPIINLLLGILTCITTNNIILILATVVLELSVVGFEAFIYYNVMDARVKKCVVISLLTNICSFAIGLFFSGYFRFFI